MTIGVRDRDRLLASAVQELAPEGAVVVVRTSDVLRAPTPTESIDLNGAVSARVREFVTTRQCAYEAMEAVGVETEAMLGPERSPAEAAESEGLIYTLRVALGIVDEAGYPIPSE